MSSELNYDAAGATQPEAFTWGPTPSGYRRFERSTRIGNGPAHWEFAVSEILRWGIKTRSGFSVAPLPTEDGDARVRENADYTLTARVGPVRIHEPVRVLGVVDDPDRCGFAYGTREGHPVSGEEAFIVLRTPGGAIWLTLRSLTRPAPGVWGMTFPALLIAQRFYRARYLRALMQAPR